MTDQRDGTAPTPETPDPYAALIDELIEEWREAAKAYGQSQGAVFNVCADALAAIRKPTTTRR